MEVELSGIAANLNSKVRQQQIKLVYLLEKKNAAIWHGIACFFLKYSLLIKNLEVAQPLKLN
jgi:hypothetical protein